MKSYNHWIPWLTLLVVIILALLIAAGVVALFVGQLVLCEYQSMKKTIDAVDDLVIIGDRILKPIACIVSGTADTGCRVVQQLDRIAVGGLSRVADVIEGRHSCRL